MREQIQKQQEMIDQMHRQQDLINQMLATMTRFNTPNASQARSYHSETVDSPRRDQEKFTAATGNAIKFLKSQIPCFSGIEGDDVDLWIEKVEGAANAYDFSQRITLAAATANLTKIAKDWFNTSSGEVNTSWITFKEEIIDRFRRKVLTNVVRKKNGRENGYTIRNLSKNMR